VYNIQEVKNLSTQTGVEVVTVVAQVPAYKNTKKTGEVKHFPGRLVSHVVDMMWMDGRMLVINVGRLEG